MDNKQTQSTSPALLVHHLLNATRNGTNMVGNQLFVGPIPVEFYMETTAREKGIYTVHFGSNFPFCDAWETQILLDVPRISLPIRGSRNRLYIASVDLDSMLSGAFFFNPPVRIGDHMDHGQVGAADYARIGNLCPDCTGIYLNN